MSSPFPEYNTEDVGCPIDIVSEGKTACPWQGRFRTSIYTRYHELEGAPCKLRSFETRRQLARLQRVQNNRTVSNSRLWYKHVVCH